MSQRRIPTHEFNSSGELWVPDRERPGSRIVPQHSWSTHQASLIALSSSCSAVNRPVVATRSLRSNRAHLDAAEPAITVTVARSGFHISARCAAAGHNGYRASGLCRDDIFESNHLGRIRCQNGSQA
jgi:hypothetical protein